MPSYSHLYPKKLYCPACHRPMSGADVYFFYGKVNSVYDLNNAIESLRDGDGRIAPPFTLVDYPRSFMDSLSACLLGIRWPWNYGEPGSNEVVVLEYDSVYRTEPEVLSCCGCKIEATVIEVKENAILSCRMLQPGQFEAMFGLRMGGFNVLTKDADGSWNPRRDWFEQANHVLHDLRKR